jgi:hypothetical protein
MQSGFTVAITDDFGHTWEGKPAPVGERALQLSAKGQRSVSQSRSVDSDVVDVDVDQVVGAAREHRPDGVRAGLDRAVGARGLSRCFDEVLLPAIRELGRWPAGEDHEPTVRLSVETMRAWVESVLARAPAPTAGPPVIMACAPGDRHSLPLEALTVLLRYRLQPCRMLGPRVSAHAMSIALEVNRPAAVVIAAQLHTGYRQSTSLLQAMDEIGITAFYAGAAFDLPLARHDLPGTYLGTNLGNACELVLRTLRDRSGDGTTTSG